MYLSHFRSIITVCVIHHLVFTGESNSPVQHSPVDDIAVNCGFSGSTFGSDGREWIGDTDSTFTSPKEVKGKSTISSTTVHQSLCADHVPYMTARISRSHFTYTSQLRPGQKFIRLHFCPASYPGFERSKALFTVKAGPYTLLSNFSPSLTADALGGVSYFAKEFCVNIEENQVFNITFSPSKRTSSSHPDDDVYAFINGIEIVSMPTGLYYTPDGDLGPPVVGNKFFRYYIDNGTALEMVHRLNVGGRSIFPVEDLGMFRMWSDDKKYLLQSASVSQVSTSSFMITYTNIPTHSVPLEVYTIGSNQQKNPVYNFTWKLPVDVGFRYLVRLHFCELEPTSTTEGGQKQLDLLINNKKIEVDADVMKLRSGAALYRDYVVMMEGDLMDGRRDLIIALQLNNVSSSKKIDAIVKGIEVFKLSNADNNLAGGNPVFTANAPISRNTPRFQKLVLAFGSRNTIPTGIVLVLSTLLYFIVYHLKYGPNHGRSWWWWLCGLIWQLWQLLSHRWRANYRIFSVAEFRALTNNFSDDHLINTENGGDVKVYEGYMEKIGKIVIKRYFTMPTGTDDSYRSLRVQSQLECINMVSLVGYCLDKDGHEMILVHEYMANGTLFDHLHNTSNKNQCLSWKQRLQICIGAARGLNYLHSKTIIHGDVKLSNILLDQNWVAKMNISLLLREKNTLVADEEKSDVYSFGIVLFQVLSGRWNAFTMENESERRTLSELVLKCIDEAESAEQIIDPFLKGNISHPCLRAFGEIANKCLLPNATQRPPMTEVVRKLELALQLEEIANKLINKEKEEHISEVSHFLKDAGLESCNLIVGFDFTGSNKETGMRSFNGRCLHDINGDGLNPYEQSISIIGKALADFAPENLIPCFGFGDESTRAKNVFSFYSDKRFCNGFEQVLSRYREIVPHLKLSGPTSFAPIIEMAMTIVAQSGFKYHVLLLIADGEVSPSSKDATLKAIVKASKFPLSIILVGVGDGPWDMMRKFSDDIPDRAFNNFHFVNFTEIMSKNLDESLKEVEFALTALMEIPSQNKATIELNIFGGRKGNAPGRVPLPPPQGGDVKVYEGYMEKMGRVVIKRYITMPTDTDDPYKSLRVQSQLECFNLVSLVGYCLDKDGHEMILVHEYMANGTLFDHLHNTSNKNQCLSWKHRLQICIGAAQGLNYLHSKTIIHGDVKLSNILLDQNWVAKMNISLLLREKNTLVADEEKSDVYSFGIVLFQVLSGRWNAFTMENESERRTLSELVLKCIDEAESAEQIIDPFLKGNISHPCLRAFGEIANKCLLPNATQRPPMTEVVRKLELALQLEEHIYEVRPFLEDAGLGSCNLIVGIDFTGSNDWKGMRSFNGRCLHDIKGDGLNPYQQCISIIGKALADFAHENLIPCFGFGDKSTGNTNVFSFYPDKRFCNGFEQVLSRYREIVPHLELWGNTSYAPIIEMAMTIVEQSGFKYHVLLLISDGQVTSDSKDVTLKAIVEASKFPLSIILVGVGDGPWDMMRKFSDDIPDRAFNNFHFVNFTEIMSKNLDESLKEVEFALTALMEIPSQNKATIGYSHPSGRKGNALGRVPLPPPLA